MVYLIVMQATGYKVGEKRQVTAIHAATSAACFPLEHESVSHFVCRLLAGVGNRYYRNGVATQVCRAVADIQAIDLMRRKLFGAYLHKMIDQNTFKMRLAALRNERRELIASDVGRIAHNWLYGAQCHVAQAGGAMPVKVAAVSRITIGETETYRRAIRSHNVPVTLYLPLNDMTKETVKEIGQWQFKTRQ